jgi:4a-hydroxytetrahydrobiopterin dehydratase
MSSPLPSNVIWFAAGAVCAATFISIRTKKESKQKSPGTARHCTPCEDTNTEMLGAQQVDAALTKRSLWSLSSDRSRILRHIVFKNFQSALDFIVEVGAVAEAHGHHPDFHLEDYRTVRLEVYTHNKGGLTEYDLILADAIDAVPVSYSPKFLKEQNARLAVRATEGDWA